MSPNHHSSAPKDRLFFVHHRKTGVIEICRKSSFSKIPLLPPAASRQHLHYKGKDRTHACRCSDSMVHRHPSPIEKDSPHLAVALTHFLQKCDIESCSLAEFYKAQEEQKASWARDSVYLDDFHYATKEKDVVCRCTSPNNHGRGPVRNPEIIRLCAELFRSNKAKMTCTKVQWHAVDGHVLSPVSDAFEYDSQSVHELLHKRQQESRLVQPPHSTRYNNMEHLRGSNGEPDIPERVWQGARPAMWKGRRGSETSLSTPLGTATSPQYPKAGIVEDSHLAPFELRASVVTTWSAVQRDAAGNAPEVVRDSMCPPLTARCMDSCVELAANTRKSQTGFAELEAQLGNLSYNPTPVLTETSACLSHPFNIEGDLYTSINGPSTPIAELPSRRSRLVVAETSACLSHPFDLECDLHTPSIGPKTPMAELSSHLPASVVAETSACLSQPFNLEGDIYPTALSPRTPVAELHAHQVPIELPVRNRQTHAATLRELEGDYAKLSMNTTSKRSLLHAEAPSLYKTTVSQSATCLSTLFGEVHTVVGLPNQEELFLRHVVVCSRGNLAPSGRCPVCNDDYNDRRTRTLKLRSCGHYLHQECLIEDFRIRDQSIGTCPVCSLALCERGLMDRIDTDRLMIFGSHSIKLPGRGSVEFPQRGEIAHVQSEEELAAAQLRLLKDYIDVHVEDMWNKWNATHLEPDWHSTIVRPVIQLFKSWNLPSQQSRYFADRDSFLKLVAWAELVRLMNVTRLVHVTRIALDKTHTEVASFPSLSELHRKFMWAKERFDKEKRTWKTNRRGVLDCEKIANDVFQTAMRTHSDA